MRLPISMMIGCAFMMTGAAAFGASRKDHDDCNAADPDRNIAGCTRIIADITEPKTTRAIAYVGRGLAWQAKGDLDRAISDFDQAISLDRNDADAYYRRSQVFVEKGDLDHAITTSTR